MAGKVTQQGIPEADAGFPAYPSLSQQDIEELFEPQVLVQALVVLA
ncbi:hypothetical protein [Bifidobacterium pseudolongum]|uniref:Uncharacterized protein n=1 Tax=Bifidobacterium pseudolongum subsp. globosum TaxID=1690 RepID=A0A4Q5ABD5_9BIFI|nr:hypothetical protein [Bifidobacterium pseudolongum]RYQ21149.1 hypothetical protein PG2071B_0012 [Bifidobacterium pseudolongum subsp. globosum]